MTPIATSRPDTATSAALASGTALGGLPTSRTAELGTSGTSLIDRFLAPAGTSQPMNLTPVQQGEAARAGDQAAADGTTGAAIGSVVGGVLGGPIGGIVGGAVGGAIGSALDSRMPDHPISVSTTVTTRADGTTLTTNTMNVAANFRLDGGTLPSGRTAAEEAASIEQSIERDFSKTYTDANGNEVRYVAEVDMTVGQPADLAREQLVLVDATDSRIGGGLGIAPGFEQGRTAYISDEAGARTAPHEFGHLAGLRHTAQVDQGCVTGPKINIENLMSQTGCSPTSQQIERSQLEQIFRTPEFR